MKRALLVILFSAGTAAAEPVADVDAALGALRAAAPGQPRLDAATKLAALGPTATETLVARLGQARARSTDPERREVLGRFKASMPDEKGVFRSPPRPPKGGPPPEPNWLEELAKLEGSDPPVLDSLETVALIRALAASRREAGADAILDLAFSPDGTAFRDECGRFLRQMSPYSLATLLRASQDRKRADGSYARYATYQLDRLDKGRPSYALESADSDELEAAMLRAIGDVKHPDAVTAVLDRTDSATHAVRRAAREAWMAYVTGPPPPPAPKAKRKLPGGKMTDKELPLYLTYRELAQNELVRRLTELLGAAPDPKLDAEALTELLFGELDRRRIALWDDAMKQATTLASEGKWEDVERRYDAILTDDPTYGKRGEMVAGYLAAGKSHAAKGDWDAAVRSFHKAHSIDPAGPRGPEARGQLHYARAMRMRAAGESGDEELTKALAADPMLEVAREAVAEKARAHARSRSGWMLYLGIATGALALALVAWILVARRRGEPGRP